jgi:hypothetical protein
VTVVLVLVGLTKKGIEPEDLIVKKFPEILITNKKITIRFSKDI